MAIPRKRRSQLARGSRRGPIPESDCGNRERACSKAAEEAVVIWRKIPVTQHPALPCGKLQPDLLAFLHDLIAFSCDSNCSGRQITIFPRFFTITPERCHSLSRRLAVKGVTAAVLASSSFVTSTSIPRGPFRPTVCARVSNTDANL